MSTIVIFIGSFNPPTLAHERLLGAAMNAISADQGLFVPLNNSLVTKKMNKTDWPDEVLSEEAGSYVSSSHASLFEDEDTVRDFIYVQLPRGEFLKSRKSMSASGFSGMEIKTRATRLVIAFKRMRKGFSGKAAMKEALNELRTYDSGVTPEGIKLIRVGMVISPARKKLTEYQILDDKA